MGGVTPPPALARDLTPAFQAVGSGQGALPLPLRSSRHAPGTATAEEAGEQIGEEQEEEEEEEEEEEGI